jgi:capsular exopolysaccharide synthesis family protein
MTARTIDERFVGVLAPGSPDATQYLTLAHEIRARRFDQKTAVIGVSSAVAAEGKTTTAVNLAAVLAHAEGSTLLVNADLRHRDDVPLLGARPARGLAHALADADAHLDDVTIPWPGARLAIVAAGSAPSNPYDLLGSERLETLMAQARARHRYVVVDMPPLLPVPDGRAIQRCLDTLVLVVAADRTPRKLVIEAMRIVPPDKFFGVVLNGAADPSAGYYDYGSYGPPRSRGRVSALLERLGRLSGRPPA